MRNRCKLLTVLALVPAAAGFAAEPDFSAGLLKRSEIVEAARAATAETHPDADDVLIAEDTRVRYEKDGTSVTWRDAAIKVLTEKGRRGNRTLSLYYHLAYGKAEFRLLEVIKPDGRVVAVDHRKLGRVTISSGQMRSNIYDPRSKTLRVGVPGLQTGDVLRYVYVRREHKARMPGAFSDLIVLQWTRPILRSSYQIDGPRELPLRKIVLRDEVPGTVRHEKTEAGGRVRHRWTARNVPRMFDEPRMPRRYTVVQRVLVSTLPDWKTVSRWYWNLCNKPLAAVSPEMKREVAGLVKGAKDQEARTAAVFRWVSGKVRYLGISPESTAPGYEPHPVKDTFERRHGVCRDKAALLAAMLRLAGLDAYPVLIYAGPKKDPAVPQMWFNHAITCVRRKDGSYRLMDATGESSRQLMPAYLSDCSYLVASPGGETLLTSPVPPAEENLVVARTVGKLSASGDLSAECVLRFEGINDNSYRSYLSRRDREARRRYFAGLAKRMVPGARLTDLRVEPRDLRDLGRPLVVNMKFEAREVLVSGGRLSMLRLPRVGSSVGRIAHVLRRTGLEKRKYPFVNGCPCGVRESLELDASELAGKPVSLPARESIDDPTLAWRQSVSFEAGKLRAESEILLRAPEFAPRQYLKLKSALRRIEYARRKMPIFSPGRAGAGKTAAGEAERRWRASGADSVVLDETVEYRLKAAGSWTETRSVRRKVLTYAGKKAHSTLRLAFNPAWEKVELRMARVTSPGGRVQKIRPEEINVMDQPWAASAPRYPAGRRLVASLPGVDVGSLIEYRVVRTCSGRPFFAARAYLRGTDPIARKTVRVIAPRSLRLTVLREGLQGVEERRFREGDSLVYEWRTSGQERVRRQPQLPPWWSFNPTVFVSAGSWRRYRAHLRRPLLAAARRQPRAEARARKLVAGLRDPGARLRAVRDFVARQVRHAGPALNDLPAAALTPADRTLADGYGNSADRAALLFAMLRAAGFRPEFVLASRGPRLAALQRVMVECPDPRWFGSVLVRVRLGRDQIYLNDTDQYAALGATGHDLRPGFELSRGRVRTIRAAPGRGERSEVAYEVRLAPDGDARITRTRRFYASAYARTKRRFAEMSPEKRRRYRQEAAAGIARSARAEGPLVTDFEGYPGTERLTVRVERYAVRDGTRLYFRLPAGLGGLLRLTADTREHPLYWAAPRRSLASVLVVPPEGFARARIKPPGIEWNAPAKGGRVTVTVGGGEKKPGALRVEYRAELLPALVPAAAYPGLLEIERKLSHPAAATVLFEADGEGRR
jgi:transglutaminase-like putative cysteine protease